MFPGFAPVAVLEQGTEEVECKRMGVRAEGFGGFVKGFDGEHTDLSSFGRVNLKEGEVVEAGRAERTVGGCAPAVDEVGVVFWRQDGDEGVVRLVGEISGGGLTCHTNEVLLGVGPLFSCLFRYADFDGGGRRVVRLFYHFFLCGYAVVPFSLGNGSSGRLLGGAVFSFLML